MSVTAPDSRATGAARALGDALRRHWPIVVVLAAGAALRLVVMLAYQPVFWFTDTGRYLRYAELGQPDSLRPWGYSGFLWLTLKGLSEREIVALQHVLMLVLGGAIYAFLVHRRVAPWLSAVSVVPLCLSPLVVNIEHHLLADWLFGALLTASVLLLAWSDGRPAVWACALAGLALAASVVTRQVALVAVLPALVYLLLRRAGAIRLAAFAVCLAIPVVAYMSWVQSTYGVFSFSTWSGRMLYARVAPIAECSQMGALTVQQRKLCDPRPPSKRPGPESYLWKHASAQQRKLSDDVILSFARKVIVHQPVAYLRSVADYSAEAFYPGRKQRRGEACVAYWAYPYPLPHGCRTDAVGKKIWKHHPFSVNRPLAHQLARYQHLDWPIGPVMLACLLVTLFAAAWRPRIGRWRTRLDACFLAAVGLLVTIVAFATATFSYRYTLPLYTTFPVAAALAITRLRSVARGTEAVA